MELQENKLMTKTFFWMFIGLLSTAIISWYTIKKFERRI